MDDPSLNCRLCAKAGRSWQSYAPERFVEHMRYGHGVIVTIDDVVAVAKGTHDPYINRAMETGR